MAIKLSTASGKNTLNSKLEYNRSVLPNICDEEPTQEEKNRDKETVERIKSMKDKWTEMDKEGRKLLNKGERKELGQKKGLPRMTTLELESLDLSTLTAERLKWLTMNQVVPLHRDQFYEDHNLETLYNRILTRDLTGPLYREVDGYANGTEPLEHETDAEEANETLSSTKWAQRLRSF